MNQILSDKHLISTSTGSAYYFEYKFTNALNSDHLYSIQWTDPNLRTIDENGELSTLHSILSINRDVNLRLLNKKSLNVYVVPMKPNETIWIPFVYQSFESVTVRNSKSLHLDVILL